MIVARSIEDEIKKINHIVNENIILKLAKPSIGLARKSKAKKKPSTKGSSLIAENRRKKTLF